MPVTRDMLLSELRDLLRLTAFEQAITTVRRTQAASTPIADELAANARKAGERLTLLNNSVRQLGGVPDVVGPLVGRVGALLQTQLNQVQTLQGALLGDLALEHSLRERARYARTLAVTLGESSVIPVLDRLDRAHGETIGWLEQRLAEVGATGTSALRPTPVQAVVGSVRRLYGLPLGLAAAGVNRLGGLLTRAGQAAPDVLADVAGTVAGTVDAVADTAEQAAQSAAATAADVASTARDTLIDLTEQAGDAAQQAAQTVGDAAEDAAQAAGSAAQTVADTAADVAQSAVDTTASAAQTAADTAADTVAGAAETVADTTASAAEQVADAAQDVAEQAAPQPDPEKHPFAAYERLSGDSIIRHVNDTDDVEELRQLLAFEQAHKARKGVVGAARSRLGELSASV